MKFIILGCGSSMGVPRPDGFFGNCDPKNKKNYRTRCSALFQTKKLNILIDTSPDLREQLLKNKIKKIDKILYSHLHADKTHGINDLRIFYLKKKNPIPVYADNSTKKYLINSFSYCFYQSNRQYPPILKLKKIKKIFYLNNGKKKISIRTIKVKHGNVSSICYIFDKKLAYISDVSKIYKKDFKYFKNLKYIIIDSLRYQNHPSHLNLIESLNLIKLFSPKKAILTNLHSDFDYKLLKMKLPKNVVPAYDGFTIKL